MNNDYLVVYAILENACDLANEQTDNYLSKVCEIAENLINTYDKHYGYNYVANLITEKLIKNCSEIKNELIKIRLMLYQLNS